jgi:tRNA pseudouridine55 synthase
VIKAKNHFGNILPVWQPIGYSTYQITNAISKLFGVKATHTGVLDPLAEGVIIVLLGPERLNKSLFSDLKKGYEFDIVFGISTDSYDGMGLVSEFSDNPDLREDLLKEIVETFPRYYTQRVPLYSARKVNSKKLFLYPKENLEIPELPEKSGEIYKLEYKGSDYPELYALIEETISKINLVKKGEYRQKTIISKWQEFKSSHQNEPLQRAKFYAEISRGLYVRSLSQDIAKKAGTIGFVSRLVRTRNGDYTKEKALHLEDIFGKEFSHEVLWSKFSM